MSSEELKFPVPTGPLKQHPDVSATRMFRLCQERLPILNAQPDAEQRRLEIKVAVKFRLPGKPALNVKEAREKYDQQQ